MSSRLSSSVSLLPARAWQLDQEGVLESCSLLGGSWVVISRAISPLIWVISIVTLLITPSYNYP